jgi:predicted nuclease of predicted toxin-antitoxin system
LRILVDECLPEDLVGWLPAWDVSMVQQMGWAGVKNGELLRRAEGEFELFLTADKNLRYQQNLKGRRLAILLLPTNRLKVLQNMTAVIEAAIARVVPGEPDQYFELSQPAE